MSFDSRSFYIKTTLFLICFSASLSSQLFCHLKDDKDILSVFSPSSFVLCLLTSTLFSFDTSLFINPSTSSPPFYPLNHNILQPANKGSVIPLTSLFSTFLSFPCSTSPAREKLSDFGPAVSQFLMCLVDDPVLLLSPWSLLHLWV